MIMPQNLPASCYNCTGSDVLLIRMSAKFDVDLCVTFLNIQICIKISEELNVSLCLTFLTCWTRSCSNGNILQLLVNMIMPQNWPQSCYNCAGSDILLIRISAKFDLDYCVTFLNFQAGSIWKDFVNAITLYKLPVSSCNLIIVFSTSKSWKIWCWPLCDLFELSN